MRLTTAQTIKLSAAALCLSTAALAGPLPYRHRISIDSADFAEPLHVFHGIDVWDRAWEHHGSGGFNPHREGWVDASKCVEPVPAPAATPEPGYEWALGLLLVGIGCASRLRRK